MYNIVAIYFINTHSKRISHYQEDLLFIFSANTRISLYARHIIF